jgi:hypothetical protein
MQSAIDMLRNHRADLQANGYALAVGVLVLLAWIASPAPNRSSP